MVQLKILSGRQAGTTWVARRFPVRIGRDGTSDFRLEDDGIWGRHLEIQFRPGDGCVLASQGEALTRVNGEAVQEIVLHNGDSIQAGAVEMQFWLGEAPQGGLAAREMLTWAGIGAVVVSQAVLLYWLLR